MLHIIIKFFKYLYVNSISIIYILYLYHIYTENISIYGIPVQQEVGRWLDKWLCANLIDHYDVTLEQLIASNPHTHVQQLRQEYHKFYVNLGHIVRLCLKI